MQAFVVVLTLMTLFPAQANGPAPRATNREPFGAAEGCATVLTSQCVPKNRNREARDGRSHLLGSA